MAAYVQLKLQPRRDWQQGCLCNIYTDAVLLTNGEYGPNASPGEGSIDYSTALNRNPISLWPQGTKGGWGAGPWGDDIWGLGTGGKYAGMGSYPMGRGPQGFGTKPFIWSSRSISCKFRDGTYYFGIKIGTKHGSFSPTAITASVMVQNVPRPPDSFTFVSYDPNTHDLVLAWSGSIDIEPYS